jgi:hypothetical protein
MPLGRSRDPFDDPDWVFELKFADFRALAFVDGDAANLVSGNVNPL